MMHGHESLLFMSRALPGCLSLLIGPMISLHHTLAMSLHLILHSLSHEARQ